jgi:O-acetylhomoserine (thiol)-lyase
MSGDAPERRFKKGQPPSAFGFETRMIHAGTQPEPVTGARQTPIFQNTSYVFHDADHAASLFNLQTFGFIYSRLTNPTVSALEERIASLEGGRGATCCASGHAAQILAFFAFMEPGDEFIASNRLYGGSITQFGKTFKKFDWHARFVDVDALDQVRGALTPRTKAIFCESLANPGGVISDLEALAEVAQSAGIPLIVDNTLATPYLCRPFEWGADLVIHSTTKFLSGNGSAMGGCVVDSGTFDWGLSDKFAGLNQPEPAYHGIRFWESFGDLAFTTHAHAVGLRDLGATLAPMNAFLTLLGTETLALRMERHCSNAAKVADFLNGHPRVDWVFYAGLADNPYHGLAQKYLGGQAGSVFTFGVKGGYEMGMKVVESCELLSLLANVGDTRSLILHPASTTHRQLTDEQRLAAGAGPDVVRLSIGLETVDDIIADLDQALATAARKTDQAAE